MAQRYDMIVIGAGSAGCVVANRVSADSDCRVLLLEGGGADRGLRMAMPLACGQIFYHPAFNWNYATQPEPHLDDRVLLPAAGKVLGGGSSINGMMHTRGHALDFDQWAEMGCAGWSFADVLPYFKRVETNWRGASDMHGGSGPLSVSRHITDELFDQIADTARRLGYPVTEDFERDGADDFGVPDFTTYEGRRGSTTRRYLNPVRTRRNLTVRAHVQVTRVLIEKGRAVGVEFIDGGQLRRANADGEFILSAGAYGSPKLLMSSGIGPADELRDVGVDPIHDLSGVGRSLQEHLGARLTFSHPRRLADRWPSSSRPVDAVAAALADVGRRARIVTALHRYGLLPHASGA
jgi:choline dehydrogenase